MVEPAEKASAVNASASTMLAADRTRLAYERTLMAWIRTATSLITFGFSIYKFFQIELANKGPEISHLIGPREFALLMIFIGLVSLLLATLEHRRNLTVLNAQYPGGSRSLARVMAALVSVLGLTALFAVIYRQ
jgi:putative membrane protein